MLMKWTKVCMISDLKSSSRVIIKAFSSQLSSLLFTLWIICSCREYRNFKIHEVTSSIRLTLSLIGTFMYLVRFINRFGSVSLALVSSFFPSEISLFINFVMNFLMSICICVELMCWVFDIKFLTQSIKVSACFYHTDPMYFIRILTYIPIVFKFFELSRDNLVSILWGLVFWM